MCRLASLLYVAMTGGVCLVIRSIANSEALSLLGFSSKTESKVKCALLLDLPLVPNTAKPDVSNMNMRIRVKASTQGGLASAAAAASLIMCLRLLVGVLTPCLLAPAMGAQSGVRAAGDILLTVQGAGVANDVKRHTKTLVETRLEMKIVGNKSVTFQAVGTLYPGQLPSDVFPLPYV